MKRNFLLFGTDYPFVPASILEKVAAKVKNEMMQDAELSPYAEDIIRNNALKLFNMNMCEKIPMQADGIVRLSKIRVKPDYLEEYMKYAMEVGTTSLQTEPGVLTMYAVADKENPA